MSESGKFQIALPSSYERHLGNFFKKYYRHDEELRAKFEEFLNFLFDRIEENPRDKFADLPGVAAYLEPWPKGAAKTDWEFRKITFPTLGYQGAAGEGRLIYEINVANKTVYPTHIYTHDDYRTRPRDKDLKKSLRKKG